MSERASENCRGRATYQEVERKAVRVAGSVLKGGREGKRGGEKRRETECEC